MLVCHCNGVRDREIRRAVRSGARTRTDVGRRCRAGTGCGGCGPVIDRIIASERREGASLVLGRAEGMARPASSLG